MNINNKEERQKHSLEFETMDVTNFSQTSFALTQTPATLKVDEIITQTRLVLSHAKVRKVIKHFAPT